VDGHSRAADDGAGVGDTVAMRLIVMG
jgi:hypothetical protein